MLGSSYLLLGAASVFLCAVAQQLTLQPCVATTAAERFTVKAGALVDGNGRCLGGASASGDGIAAVACDGSSSQVWALNADGTVKGEASGLCWNADGGATNVGTVVMLFQCGVASPAAANDYFRLQTDGTILGTESLLCVSSVAVPPPPPTPPNGSCTTAIDCSLSGACTAGVCACYPPWTGALDCSTLKFLPSPLVRGFPPPQHNETTWGGSIALDPVGGQYHMYVAEMMNECPLETWGQNSCVGRGLSASRARHATDPLPCIAPAPLTAAARTP